MTTQLSVDRFLRLTQRELIQFVQQNITHEDGTWNVSNIVDWEDASQAKTDLLSAKLLSAVQKTIEPSVDAADLAALLAQIPSDRGSPIRQTQYQSPSRSSTVEPPENAMQEYETKCYQALLDDGCRPLFLITLLVQVSTNADSYRDLLWPWTRYPGTSNLEDWQVFSRQLRRWKEFRKWQLGNRRQKVGFSEYLKEQQCEFERMGVAAGWIARPDFVQAIRSQWKDEYDHGRQHPGNGDEAGSVLSRYAENTKRLLMDCGFVQPFQLHADPKQQDQWTTYVEYLAFECFWLRRFARSTQKLRVQHDAGWEVLVKAGLVEPIDTVSDLASTEIENMRERELERVARAARSSTAVTYATATDTAKETYTQTRRRSKKHRDQKSPGHPQKNLPSPQRLIDGIAPWNYLVDEYVQNKQKYKSAKAESDHQQHRVDWVQSEISKIAAEQKTASKSSCSVETKSRKRKLTDDATDDADVESRDAKHRRTDETENMVVGKSDNPRTTRSKKRRLPIDEYTMESPLKRETKVACETDGPVTRSRKRRKAINEKHGNQDPSREHGIEFRHIGGPSQLDSC